MKYTVFAVCWLAVGIVGAGFDNAFFQRKWPNQCNGRSDLGQALIMSIGGPISTTIAFLYSGFGEYGWSLLPIANPGCIK